MNNSAEKKVRAMQKVPAANTTPAPGSVQPALEEAGVGRAEVPPTVPEPRSLSTDSETRAVGGANLRIVRDEAVATARPLEFPDSFPMNDSGNAERLVQAHGRDFRWVREVEKFYVWDGCIWKPSRNGIEVLSLTKEVARNIRDREWANTSQSAGHRNAMVNLVKSEAEIWSGLDIFDKHPLLLSVKNGTLDLETQTLREFRREDFLCAQSPVVYDPSARCPKFDDFMKFTFGGNEETIHWMDRALGYTLTGQTGEHNFFMCHGKGGNGKTTLFQLMRLMLGCGLFISGRFSTFLESKGYEKQNYELANFVGARMVTATEPTKTGILNESLLKNVTGDGPIMVRQIRGRAFEYEPGFKLWLAMNNLPTITGTDDGIWRRVRITPFKQKVPRKMKIQDYHRILFREEGPGILNRLLRGTHDWLSEGLEPVGAIATATADYRSSQNAVQRFVAEQCVTGDANLHVKCGTLYQAYTKWATEVGEFVQSNYEFSNEIDKHFPKRRRADGEHRFGVGLKGLV